MSDLQYYNNPEEYGNYQYIPLHEIIDNYLMSREDDDITRFSPRYRILYHAKRGLRELYYDVLREIKAVQMTLSPTLSIPMPPDYVNYVRISWVDEKGNLHPMSINNKMSIAQGYLQDHQHNLLFDENGCILKDDGQNGQLSTIVGDIDDNNESKVACKTYNFCLTPFIPNKNMSNYFPNGSYNINKELGIIQFSSDVQGKNIVLEYISDGLYKGCEDTDENFRVHKFAEQALLNFIYFELIKQRGTVAMNEKMRAEKAYFRYRRIAKRRINTIRRDELIQTFKGSSRWVKP